MTVVKTTDITNGSPSPSGRGRRSEASDYFWPRVSRWASGKMVVHNLETNPPRHSVLSGSRKTTRPDVHRYLERFHLAGGCTRDTEGDVLTEIRGSGPCPCRWARRLSGAHRNRLGPAPPTGTRCIARLRSIVVGANRFAGGVPRSAGTRIAGLWTRESSVVILLKTCGEMSNWGRGSCKREWAAIFWQHKANVRIGAARMGCGVGPGRLSVRLVGWQV